MRFKSHAQRKAVMAYFKTLYLLKKKFIGSNKNLSIQKKEFIKLKKDFVAKYKYQIYVKPEGENEYKPIHKYFTNKKEAITYANIESVAGMGETYEVRKSKL